MRIETVTNWLGNAASARHCAERDAETAAQLREIKLCYWERGTAGLALHRAYKAINRSKRRLARSSLWYALKAMVILRAGGPIA